MCGFVGIVNLKDNLNSKKDILISMNDTLKKRGPDECGYYVNDNALLGHRRLIVIDPDGGKQPSRRRDIRHQDSHRGNGGRAQRQKESRCD